MSAAGGVLVGRATTVASAPPESAQIARPVAACVRRRPRAGRPSGEDASERRRSDRAFLAVAALVFVASATLTVVGCRSMSEMGGMAMPGGWTMSMAWMRMPGQTWLGAAASFLGMWVVMMVAMMMPSLVPMLRRYRRAVEQTGGLAGSARLGSLTAVVGLGYFSVWTVVGIVVFPVGVAFAAVAMRQPTVARAVPFAVAVAVLLAGLHQLSAWKARDLASCRELPRSDSSPHADAATAGRHGLRLGLHCSRSCASLMAVLLVVDVMGLGAMAAVTAAMTAERLAGESAARAVGAVLVSAGALAIARMAGLG